MNEMNQDQFTVGEALRYARHESKKTQEQFAEEMGINIKTVQYWEAGKSEPSVSDAMTWFRIAGVNPITYMLCYLHPDKFGIDNMRTATQVGEAYDVIARNLSIADKIALIYLFSGEHGSSPSSVVQLTLAHLNNPLRDRIMVAEHILKQYRFNEWKGALVGTEENRPDIEMLENAIKNAEESLKDGKSGYVG